MVIKASKIEIGYAEKNPIWTKIHRHVARPKGWKIIKSRWIDVNKGDDENHIYRSRMVGKEFNDKATDGLFAATPPLEALRRLLSWAATADGKGTGSVAGVRNQNERKSISIADAPRAFFEAPARRDVCVCVELPEEALGEGETTADVAGKLMASLYGTRDTSANWQESTRQWGD